MRNKERKESRIISRYLALVSGWMVVPFDDMEIPGAELGCILFEMLIGHFHGNIMWIDKVSVQVDVDLVCHWHSMM